MRKNYQKKIATLIVISIFLFQNFSYINAQLLPIKPRTIVTTDGEIDDQDSFIRFLLYSNEFNVEGLVYTSSEWHYKGDGKGTTFISEMPMTKKLYGTRTELRWIGTQWMQNLIDKYAMVYQNLVKNDKGYPTPTYLKSIIRVGNIDFEGEMNHNTEGSDLIKNILLDNKPGPVYILTWGGTNTAARALKEIEDEYKNTPQWKTIYKKVSNKAILYEILDQDATYTTYVEPHWPDIRVVYNAHQFWCLAYPWKQVVPLELQNYLDGKWFAKNIKFNHGTLASSYFLWGDGQKIQGDPDNVQGDTAAARKAGMDQYDFISEGDSPSFLYLINTGLRNREDPAYGGWGGRFVASKTNSRLWEDGKEITDYNPYTKIQDAAFPQTRWTGEIQNDFAARAEWCVKSYKDCNHPPVVKITGPKNLTAKPGQKIKLSGTASDPDGNEVTYHWWQYAEAGTYPEKIEIQDGDSQNASITIPKDVKPGQNIQIVLEVKDNGAPQLTRYGRIVIAIK